MSPIATFLLAFCLMLLVALALRPVLRRPEGACEDAGPGCAACRLPRGAGRSDAD